MRTVKFVKSRTSAGALYEYVSALRVQPNLTVAKNILYVCVYTTHTHTHTHANSSLQRTNKGDRMPVIGDSRYDRDKGDSRKYTVGTQPIHAINMSKHL
jgi:hypothetical protein